jgi:uncharacterized protein (DUF433 family)
LHRRKLTKKTWTECAVVEIVPGKVSGQPIIKGTRVPVQALIVNRAMGEAWLAESFSLPAETVREVLAFYDAHRGVVGAVVPLQLNTICTQGELHKGVAAYG